MIVAASKHMCARVRVVGWGYACLCTWVLRCRYKYALSCQILSWLLHNLMIFAGLWQIPNLSALITMDTHTCPPAFLPVLLGMKASDCLSIDVGSVKRSSRCPSVRP